MSRSSQATPGVTSEALLDVLESLTQEMRVVRDVLDEIRKHLSWGPKNDWLSDGTCPVLNEMARDPTGGNTTALKRLVFGVF